ncbi:MAG: hypothetical protein RI953_1585 [Pseudomonadota bacterium]|jgi:hypothetical protein
MPVLKNRRYEEFETSTPRDSFRGVPLQRFPWLLEEKTVRSAGGRLEWQVQIHCLSTSPSGFGSKLNLNLQATAKLTSETCQKLAFPGSNELRVAALFGQMNFEVADSLEKSVEGHLEDLSSHAAALLKAMGEQLNKNWNVEQIQEQLRLVLRRSSPGGFGRQPQA